MSEMIHSLSDPALQEAVEANFSEEMACMARSFPGGELYENAGILRFFTGASGFNGVLRTRISSSNSAYIHTLIAETLDYFRTRKVSIGWPVTPLTQPPDLGRYLEAHGLTLKGTDTEMVLDIQQMNNHLPTPSGFTIEEVEDREALQIWRTITIQGFETSQEMGQFYHDAYARLGFGQGMPWRHYIGWLRSDPVAIASLLLHTGIAGIYGVATIPKARKQGLGTAMTLHALHEAQKLGYRIAALAPSKMAANIYRRIGFLDYTKTQFYRWSPDQ